jgi:hypothetical protein
VTQPSVRKLHTLLYATFAISVAADAGRVIVRAMTRDHLLAAEIFAYSFADYAKNLQDGHIRFKEEMPNTVRNLEKAENENWPDEDLATAINMDMAKTLLWKKRFRHALEVVDAPDPVTAFRNAVRQSIANELGRHQLGDAELESAVTQVCFRTADLSFVLDMGQMNLSDCSVDLRSEG